MIPKSLAELILANASSKTSLALPNKPFLIQNSAKNIHNLPTSSVYLRIPCLMIASGD